jgi:hypothetical protein
MIKNQLNKNYIRVLDKATQMCYNIVNAKEN